MKNFTFNNYKKALAMVQAKGYKGAQAENVAINCFVVYRRFNSYADVEDVIRRGLPDAPEEAQHNEN